MEHNIQTKTKLIFSSNLGTPHITNRYGSLVNLLKTVLVDGYNSQEVLELFHDRETKLLKINLKANHGFLPRQVVSISGSSDSKLNSDFRVIEVDHTAIYVYIESISNLDQSGVTIKGSPLGFELAYDAIEAKGIACFKNSKGHILKVIDAIPPNGYPAHILKYARVVAGSEIDSEGNFVENLKFPRHSQFPDIELTGNGVSGVGGIHGFLKWDYAGGSSNSSHYDEQSNPPSDSNFPTPWVIIGDSETFYLMVNVHGKTVDTRNIMVFGAIDGYLESDCIIVGSERAIPSTSGYNGRSSLGAWNNSFTNATSNAGCFISNTSLGNYEPQLRISVNGLFIDSSGNSSKNPSWANIANAGIFSTPIYISDQNRDYRGRLRGIEQPYGNRVELIHLTVIENSKKVILSPQFYDGNSSWIGTVPYIFSLEDW